MQLGELSMSSYLHANVQVNTGVQALAANSTAGASSSVISAAGGQIAAGASLAYCKIAEFYQSGEVVPVAHGMAVQCYQKATEHCCEVADEFLACYYEKNMFGKYVLRIM